MRDGPLAVGGRVGKYPDQWHCEERCVIIDSKVARHRGAASFLIVLYVAACVSPAPTQGPASVHGLIVLGGGQPKGQLEAWIGKDPLKPAATAIPDASGVEWLAVSIDGRIATTSEGRATVRLSDPVEADTAALTMRWRDVEIASPDGQPVPAPFRFLGWDPSGSRISFVGGDDGETDQALVIADSATGNVARTFPLSGDHFPILPVWLDDHTIAVTMVANTSDVETRTDLLDVDTGVVTRGPARRIVAATPDGRLVLTTPGPLIRQLEVQATEIWLGGSDTSIATLAEPSEVDGRLGFAFDPAGRRLAIAWGVVSGGTEKSFVQVFEGSGLWKDAGSTPAVDLNFPTAVGWLR